jgi:multidrug efflux pump subunit AcrA (membrane-fusion protein)
MNPRRRAQSTARWVVTGATAAAVMVAIVLAILRFSSPLVVVSEAVEGPVVQAFYSTGTVQPDREFPIKANVAGTIAEVRVDKGDAVTKGQPLAVVSEPGLVFAQRKAQAELEEKQKRADPRNSPVLQEFDARITAGEAQLDIAQRELARIKSLIEKAAASQTDLDSASDRVKTVWTMVESAKAQRAARKLELERELHVAKAALDTANWDLEQRTLKSPIDGVVLNRPLSVGTRVAVNDPVMIVADVRPEKLVMRAAVDEEDVTKVRVGQLVRMTLYSYDDRAFEGKVARIYPQADPERRTFEVDVQIADPDQRLQPGMTGELAFVMDAKERAVVVPSQAVQKGAIYTVENGRLKKLSAEIGLRGIERSEVLTGLKPGDRVVISTVGDIKDGQRVRTSYTDPATAAGMNKPKQVNDNFKGFN